MSGLAEAYVTLATTDSYSIGALVLGDSLKRAGTTRKLVVMVTSQVTAPMRALLEKTFDEIHLVNALDSQDTVNLQLLTRPDLGVTFTKLHCWRLTQFVKCVFLDADTLVVQNVDDLFDRDELSAASDCGWPDCFNSGVFVFRPSLDTYIALLRFALKHGSFDGGDQGLLNLYFRDWATKDISKRLPFIYNVAPRLFYTYLPALKRFGKDVKVVHFIGPLKPWHHRYNVGTGQVETSEGSDHCLEYVQLWWSIFIDTVHPQIKEQLPVGEYVNLTDLKWNSTEASATPGARQSNWEQGDIDYLGIDSFKNIITQLELSIRGCGEGNVTMLHLPTEMIEEILIQLLYEELRGDGSAKFDKYRIARRLRELRLVCKKWCSTIDSSKKRLCNQIILKLKSVGASPVVTVGIVLNKNVRGVSAVKLFDKLYLFWYDSERCQNILSIYDGNDVISSSRILGLNSNVDTCVACKGAVYFSTWDAIYKLLPRDCPEMRWLIFNFGDPQHIYVTRNDNLLLINESGNVIKILDDHANCIKTVELLEEINFPLIIDALTIHADQKENGHIVRISIERTGSGSVTGLSRTEINEDGICVKTQMLSDQNIDLDCLIIDHDDDHVVVCDPNSKQILLWDGHLTCKEIPLEIPPRIVIRTLCYDPRLNKIYVFYKV